MGCSTGANLLDHYNGEGGTGCLHQIEWSAIMGDNRPHRIQLGIDTSPTSLGMITTEIKSHLRSGVFNLSGDVTRCCKTL